MGKGIESGQESTRMIELAVAGQRLRPKVHIILERFSVACVSCDAR